jgi:hypothetical protein
MDRRIRRILRLDTGRGDRIEAELDEEIRFHLDERVRELVAAGMSRENAEAHALARFGPYDRARAEHLGAARHREDSLSMYDSIEALRTDVF